MSPTPAQSHVKPCTISTFQTLTHLRHQGAAAVPATRVAIGVAGTNLTPLRHLALQALLTHGGGENCHVDTPQLVALGVC